MHATLHLLKKTDFPALRRLRHGSARLQLLQEPSLPEVPEQCGQALA
jgi:hypothetical protein